MRREPPPSDLVIYPSDPREAKGLSELQDLVRGKRYIAERKFDGYRALLIISGRNFWFTSKNAHVLNGFDLLGQQLRKHFAPYRTLILDGEIASLNAADECQFANVHLRRGPYIYCAFDLVRVNELDARPLPLEERKHYLRRLIPRSGDFLRYVAPLRGLPPNLLNWAIKHGHEGIVLKSLDEPYVDGPKEGDWIKIKRKFSREELRFRNRLFAR